MKAAHGKGHTLKHSRAKKTKHSSTTKHHPVHHVKTATKHAHHVHTKAKHATHAKARGFSLAPGDVACCTIEALGASLRFQGLSVTDAEMLGLFRLAAGDKDKGLPVRVALEAASAFGLAGYRPDFEEVMPSAPGLLPDICCADDGLRVTRAGLIVGVDLPGAHTVLTTPDGWWSWGSPWCPWCDFPDAVIEEAWAIEWAVAA